MLWFIFNIEDAKSKCQIYNLVYLKLISVIKLILKSTMDVSDCIELNFFFTRLFFQKIPIFRRDEIINNKALKNGFGFISLCHA